MRGTTGRTAIRIIIDADGKVTSVETLSSSPRGVFENAARRVGMSLRFHPALRNGRPVGARVSLNIVWNLED